MTATRWPKAATGLTMLLAAGLVLATGCGTEPDTPLPGETSPPAGDEPAAEAAGESSTTPQGQPAESAEGAAGQEPAETPAAEQAAGEGTAAVEEQAEDAGQEQPGEGAAAKAADPKMAPLPIELPQPQFKGTPKNIKFGGHVEKPRSKPRPPVFAPKGVENVARGKPVTSSEQAPLIGEVSQVTDGDKEGVEGSYVELGPGLQWVQIDLKEVYEIHAILVWHFHGEGQVYQDVVVQLADDPDFIENVRTVYNNDYDNSAGLGLGTDKEYLETYEGHLIRVDGLKARYVRLYSNGNTSNEFNRYTEVEVYGRKPGT